MLKNVKIRQKKNKFFLNIKILQIYYFYNKYRKIIIK